LRTLHHRRRNIAVTIDLEVLTMQLSVVLDAIDGAILQELQRDGRLSNVALAERVRLSPSACLRRLKALEDAGVIEGYRAILDRRKLGLDLTVFVEIEITGQSPRRAVEFEQAIVEIDEIVSCHSIAGPYEFLLH